jgi:hypothetical protein
MAPVVDQIVSSQTLGSDSDSDKEEDNVNVEYKSWTQRRARRQRQYKGIKSVQVRLLIATFRTS